MSEADVPAESVVPAPEQRPGRALAEARGQRNQTITEIAQQLKLSAHQVEALEADDYAKLPGPVFVRGFIRNYARLMDLDAEALVARLSLPLDPLATGASLPHSHNIPFPDGRGPRWPIFAAAIAALALIVVLFEFIYTNAPDSVDAVPASKTEALQPGVITNTQDIAPVAPVPLPVAEPSASAVTEPASEPASSAPSKSAGIAEVQMVFEAQSWVEVRDRDDRIVFSQLNPAGAVQNVQGQAPLNVVIGNASGVRVTYNGKPVDLTPHTRVEVARLTLD